MKILTLKDGTQYDVLDDSSVGNIRIQVENFAEADEIETNLTRENMTEIQIGVEIFHEVNPVAFNVTKQNGEMICSVFCQESLEDFVQNQIDNYTEKLIEEGVI